MIPQLFVLLLSVFQYHVNGAQIDVKMKAFRRHNHFVGKIYYEFNNAESALKLAEMLINVTFNLQADNSESIKLRHSIEYHSILTNRDDRDRININVFFKNWAKQEGEEYENFDLINNIYYQFNVICEKEKNKYSPSRSQEYISIVHICNLGKKWLSKTIEIYSNETKVKLKKFDDEYNKKVRNGKIILNGILRLISIAPVPATTKEKKAEQILMDKYTEKIIEMARKIYYKIYKHALAYVLISEGIPTMAKLKNVKILTFHKSKMSKGQYLIYWLNTILKQMDKSFKLETFDPIKEKEGNVDMSKLKMALGNYNNVTNGNKFTSLMAGQLAAYAHYGNFADDNANGRK